MIIETLIVDYPVGWKADLQRLEVPVIGPVGSAADAWAELRSAIIDGTAVASVRRRAETMEPLT